MAGSLLSDPERSDDSPHSGEKEQEYFSDGLTEELLNPLAQINELQVAARTSAFSFKGRDNDFGMIARKLNERYGQRLPLQPASC